jgi:glycosyltransferase involved in cell wall biosynthesis
MDLTIVICTYNNQSGVKRLIDSIDALNFKGKVLVVNNHVKQHINLDFSGSQLQINVIRCIDPGLSNARKFGVHHVTTEYLLFMDDDMLFTEFDFLGLVTICKTQSIDIFGVSTVHPSLNEIPYSFHNKLSYYAIGMYAADKKIDRPILFGAGLGGRKAAFLEILKGDLLLKGRTGDSTATVFSGEDTEIVMRALVKDMRVWCFNSFVVKHDVAMDRFTETYFIALFTSMTRYGGVISSYKSARRNFPRLYFEFRRLCSILILLLDAKRLKINYKPLINNLQIILSFKYVNIS